MRSTAAFLAIMALSSPAFAQIGGFSGILKKAQEVKQQVDEVVVSEAEERQIGEDVSAKIRQRFGVVQDPAIHKYVSLMGTALAQQTDRPNLAWTFVVLDTDGVNAFASPGGFVHITRGALALIADEAELAGVLGHEIGHVVRKHTVNAIQKNKAVATGVNQAGSGRNELLQRMANQAYAMVLENNFDRNDELDADHVGVQLAQKLGYAPALGDFLARLDERNKDQAERNGLFASHPETRERITKIQQQGGTVKTTALGLARYKASVSYPPMPITSIAVVTEGSAGLAGSSAPPKEDSKKDDAKKDEPKKKGFGLSALNPTASQEKQSTQVSASGGARGLGADRAAKGGGNPALVRVTVTASDVESFKKGIA